MLSVFTLALFLIELTVWLVESGNVFFRKIKGSKIGNFSIVFRVLKARGKAEEILKDQFGREIYALEGFVFNTEEMPIVTKADFAAVHQSLADQYHQKFWDLTEPPAAFSSDGFPLDSAAGNPLSLTSLPDFQVASKPAAPSPTPYDDKHIQNERGEKKSSLRTLPIVLAVVVILVLLLLLKLPSLTKILPMGATPPTEFRTTR